MDVYERGEACWREAPCPSKYNLNFYFVNLQLAFQTPTCVLSSAVNLLLCVEEFSSAERLCLDLSALVSPLKHTV